MLEHEHLSSFIQDIYGGFINCNHVARFYYRKNTDGTYSVVARLVDGYEEIIDVLDAKEEAVTKIEYIIKTQERKLLIDIPAEGKYN